MKFAALVSTILALGACSTAPAPTPEAENFLDKLAGQPSLQIQEWEDIGSTREIITSTFTIQNGGRLLVNNIKPTITLKFIKELGNYVAQYGYYEGATQKGLRYFTAAAGQIFISEALPDLTPEVPVSKRFLDKIIELKGTGIKIDGYLYNISSNGETLTDPADPRYTFNFDRDTGDYSAAYKLNKTVNSISTHISTKIFTWKNGYYISEAVDFGS